ncbi:MAG: helicase C-terminal domain-containing protein [Ignavibacteria bacterium]
MSNFTSEIESIFSDKGLLSKLPDFEYRKPQQDMAVQIAESLEDGTHFIVEAPTGVGKSFAYLVPSVIFSKTEKRKAIISTCTINLQEQLIKKDIPALQKVLPYEFKPEILKGRHNYICTKRLNNALIKKNNLFVDAEQEQLEKIYNHVQVTGQGTRQDIPFKIDENVWSQIFAEEGVCTSKSCGSENSNCFFQQAKVKLKDADLIILNHYLFFTLFGFYERKSSGYLFADDFAVFDESHQIEQIAAENVSPSVTKQQIRFWLYRLYNPKTQKGFLANQRFSSLANEINGILSENEYFFDEIEQILNSFRKNQFDNMIRVREPIIISDTYERTLKGLAESILNLVPRAKTDDEESELKNYHTKCSAFANTINCFVNQKLDDHVYWAEFSGRARSNTELCMSPIDMADYFRNNVFTENRLSVMTSATLSISKSLHFFKRSIGAEMVKESILDPVFDYPNQMTIYIPKNIPEPKQKQLEKVSDFFEQSEYEKNLKEKIFEYITMTNGGALVLFTNSRLLRQMYEELHEKLTEAGIDVYAQGDGMPKHKLLNDFKKNINSVLFGVASFWMGVDVPGSSLRNVIITKLPFDVPDHPIIEAKIEAIVKRGGNPFMELSLPSAILKFKQGTGRLIRNKTDKGILVILDSRVINKFYGKMFINSLPECEIVVEE